MTTITKIDKPAGEVIGHIVVPEGTKEFTARRYETAGAYDILLPTPGRYEIKRDSRTNLTYMVSAKIDCLLLEDYYPNSLMGVVRPSRNIYSVAKPDAYYWRGYDYQIKPDTADLNGWNFTPTEAWAAEGLRLAEQRAGC